jgi:acyl-[acyl-carrier-protein]-phospholipid O-acyltransferase/long-chain-fatty-acid--[acyl-carrier-protein] ligase
MLATANVVTFSAMILASGVLWLCLNPLGISPATLFLIMGLASFAVIAYIMRLLPDFLLRFILWLGTHSIYRVRLLGEENLPRQGGALLICNHVSYADGALLQACTQRFLRQIIEKSWYENRLLKPFFRLLGTISVPTDEGPKAILKALRQASEALRRGELVCLFAEGSITRTGNLLKFTRGLELIMDGVDVPIIPVYLDRVWGSVFSFEGGRVLRKLPARFPYPVTVVVGQPLAARSSASAVRAAVAELSVEAFRQRSNDQDLLSTRFFWQARRVPFRFCMADSSGRSLRYGQACVGAMALARALRRACPGEEMVGILLPTSVPAALVNIALTMLGKCPVNLNFTASREALQRAQQKCAIRQVVTSRLFLEKLGIEPAPEHLMLEDLAPTVTRWDRLAALLGFCLLPHRLLRRYVREDRSRTVWSTATVIFSSGSTGDPKGVMLSHANLHANIEGLFQTLDLRASDSVLGVLPFFHSFGLTGTLWLPLTSGLGAVYHPNPLDFKVVGELAARFRPTVLTSTPTFLMGYLRKCEKEQFASLRYVVVGAEKLRERLAAAFREKFGLEPLEGYGCTELSPIVAINRPDFVSPKLRQTGLKPGTIGHPLPGIAVRCVDPDTWQPLPPGCDGLLLVKGANVMQGYIGDEARTREVMREGWYITGDLASIDNDGFITIRDRLSRFSKIGGEMVPHVRIEEDIHAVLGVKGEMVCVVTAVPDERKGEALAVLCKGDLDVAAIRAGLAQAGLPNLWIPKPDYFFGIAEIPLLGTGKLDLRRIKELARERAEALPRGNLAAPADTKES